MGCLTRGSVVLLLVIVPGGARGAAPVDFEKSFAAIVVKNCVGCHNATDPRGELDLTRPEGLFKGGKTGPVIVAGKPKESYLIERVAEGSMPPKKKGQRLSRAEVAALRAWVEAGARWPAGRVLSPFEFTTGHRAGHDWWSLQPLSRPAPPDVQPRAWARNPIDAFVLARLTQQGLSPAPEADRVTYLRRATYDLLGLPPTPEEVDAFVADRSPDAYEKLIDRLLASPRYGERWARHWLDVVRFGESDGFENDRLRAHAWHYRDYVIHSFNADKPYPQFVKEQLAGDVLEPLTRDGIAATGFLVAGPWDEIQNVGKSKLERQRAHEEQLEELIGTVAQTFLGMTVNCARCHDHKFDPIPQSDYYRLKAVFDGVEHGNRPLLPPDEERARVAALAPIQARLQQLRTALDEAQGSLPADATVVGTGPRPLGEGRFGKALDGRQAHATVASRHAFHTPPLTVECWARVDSKKGFNILVANNPKESSAHWEIYTYAQSGEFSAYLPGYAPAEIKSGVDVTDGKWHYLAMVCNGHRVGLHVDGRLVKEVAVTRQAADGPVGQLSFGAYPPQQIRCDGALDEVRLSNVIRTIDRVPDSPFTADEQTLGLWHFDAVEAQQIKDVARSAKAPALTQARQRCAALEAALKQQEAELAKYPIVLAYSGVRHQPEPTTVLLRGDVRQSGAAVTAGGLAPIRAPAPDLGLAPTAPEGLRRLRFAEWVTHPDHPLTARVMVNRIWQYHFGQGLIDTPSDFGFNGGLPSHPELLDWLARAFNASGGSVKKMHRLILLSATYRQAAQFQVQAAQRDAEGRLLWRFTPRWLEGEVVRDAMLAVSGELNPRMGGPSYQPFTTTAVLTSFYHLVDADTPELNRRTVYRINVNTAKSPLLDALDCPAPSIAMPKRRATTTPLQALALMNDSFVVRQAERFARRVQRLAGPDVEAQVQLAYRLAFGRLPTAAELDATAQVARTHGLDGACWALLNASEFLYVR